MSVMPFHVYVWIAYSREMFIDQVRLRGGKKRRSRGGGGWQSHSQRKQ